MLKRNLSYLLENDNKVNFTIWNGYKNELYESKIYGE